MPSAAVVAKNATTAADGKIYNVDYYNLDMIISIGYRVNSVIATRFRQWATQTLKEFMVKGFVMDDERLENNERIHKNNYFDELLERVRKIRTSEKLMYDKVKDLFLQTSYDYSSNSQEAKDFYATIQNKFHYAATGMTAAEIVYNRLDSDKENAGLLSFKGHSPTTEEAKIAKNYLLEDELKLLTLISNLFLDFAEIQIAVKRRLYMKDWITKLDEMLKTSDLKILQDKGKISRELVETKVKGEMEKYREKISVENAKQIETKIIN